MEHNIFYGLIVYFSEIYANFVLSIKSNTIMPQICSLWDYHPNEFCRSCPCPLSCVYNEYKVIISIKDGVVKGEMPGRALKMILEWLEQHKEELMENWKKAQKGDPLKKIEPLK